MASALAEIGYHAIIARLFLQSIDPIAFFNIFLNPSN
jgi:hypothetical protein